jgi:hypothetical protein
LGDRIPKLFIPAINPIDSVANNHVWEKGGADLDGIKLKKLSIINSNFF